MEMCENVTLVMLKWFKNGENPIENRGERYKDHD